MTNSDIYANMSDEVSRSDPTDDVSTADPETGEVEGRTDSGPGRETVSDPASLVDRDDVAHVERTYPHEDADHCETDAAGRAVVGVTNDAGAVLLLVNEAGSHAVLPNCTVDPDEEFAAVARRTVEASTGVSVQLASVEQVRTVDHVVDGDSRATNHHVVFGASPVESDGDEPQVPDDEDEWDAGWYDELPVSVEPDQPVGVADAIDDVRLFLD